VDGVLSQGEWDQAARVEIKVADGWVVTVLAQHDDKNFYIAFTGLRHGNAERYPEVLLDPAAEKSLLWKQGQWWFHASYNLCDSNGKPNNYTTCQPSKQGWNGTRFPLKQGVSEIAISLDKVGLAPGKRFGLAFDITDTKAEWNLWPNSAKLKIPMSWAEAQME